MTRPSLTELSIKLNDVRKRVPLGEHYRHQRTGVIYVITGHAIREYDASIVIEYEPLEQTAIYPIRWTRPEAEFFAEIKWRVGDGDEIMKGPRFKRVIKADAWVDED